MHISSYGKKTRTRSALEWPTGNIDQKVYGKLLIKINNALNELRLNLDSKKKGKVDKEEEEPKGDEPKGGEKIIFALGGGDVTTLSTSKLRNNYTVFVKACKKNFAVTAEDKERKKKREQETRLEKFKRYQGLDLLPDKPDQAVLSAMKDLAAKLFAVFPEHMDFEAQKTALANELLIKFSEIIIDMGLQKESDIPVINEVALLS